MPDTTVERYVDRLAKTADLMDELSDKLVRSPESLMINDIDDLIKVFVDAPMFIRFLKREIEKLNLTPEKVFELKQK